MKKIILVGLLILISGCVRMSYEAKEEFKNQIMKNSRLSNSELTIGILFKDETAKDDSQKITGDLGLETADWLTNSLIEEKKFKKVVNLNKNSSAEVDLVLKGIIKQIKLEDPGISGISKVLGILYGVSPIVEHYSASIPL